MMQTTDLRNRDHLSFRGMLDSTWHRCITSGHCQKCSYDLTGNESGKCPECGETCESRTDEQH